MSESVGDAVARVQAPGALIEPVSGPMIEGPQTRASITAQASDIPRSCWGCRWLWKISEHRWAIIQIHPRCPWHGRG